MIDEFKISVVVFDSSGVSYNRIKRTVDECVLPRNFQLDFVVIVDSKNKMVAYNKAILQSNAKYRFYIDASTEILRKDLFESFVRLFSNNPEIGILGCLGTDELPLNGIAHQARAEKTYGSCLIGEDKVLIQGVAFDGSYKEVQCIFGGIIATQYDVQWREDLFISSGSCFEFTSQCIEFLRKGYKVAVISQDKPFVWNNINTVSASEIDRQTFLREYSADVFPLVSVLIPTFERPSYFKMALESVLQQTYLNLDIIISDNSNNDETEELMQSYLAEDKRIKYYHHRDFDKSDNWLFCRNYDNPESEYVNWLMDDDLFLPRKIELMVDCYRKNPDVSLCFSNRLFIDSEGKVLRQNLLSKENFKMLGEEAGRQLFFRDNFIGEPTTVLIKKKYLRDNDLGWTKLESTFERIDFSTWLHMLTQGNLFYFAEPLSCCREHVGQASKQLKTQIDFVIEYSYEIIYAWQNHFFLKTANDFRKAALRVLDYGLQRLEWAYQSDYSGENLSALEKAVRDLMDRLMLISFKERTGGAVADVHSGV